mmetsp:Transcript_13156/g.14836  ORF Transcript_13156/g.14836 Transcript_13156/m.14836 type:complete len:600 (-) Transcript_13156:247-2046(-)
MPLFRRIIQVLSVCSVTSFGTVFVQANHGTGATQCHWSGQNTDHGNSLSGNNITCDCVDGHWRNCRYNHDDGDKTKSCYFLGEETKHGDFWTSSTIACECKNAHWDCHYVDQGSNDRHEQGCHYRGQDVKHGERLTGETKSCECNHGKWRRCYDKDNHCHRDGKNYPAGEWYELPHTNEKCYCEWDTTWSQCEALQHNPDSSPTSTRRPTSKPTDKPSSKPSLRPTPQPTPAPVPEWTGSPTKAPIPEWTGSPTKPPSPEWTGSPTKPPSPEWTGSPTQPPSRSPTFNPTPRTPKPTPAPITPDAPPSPEPTPNPTQPPTRSPTLNPSARPSRSPTNIPSKVPTPGPTPPPSPGPTPRPTLSPTERPTVPSDGNFEPTVAPTGFPTGTPTELGTFPTFNPSARPSNVWVENQTPTVVPAEFGSVQTFTPSARPLTEGCETIAEFVCNNDDFSILCAALQRLYLFDILNNKEGQYTFFAPNDIAFEKYLEEESVTEMTDINSDILKNVLLTNVMAGVLDKKRFIVRCGQIATMINMEITRTFCETTTDATDTDDGGYTLHQIGVGNADDEKKPKLIETDINACNGIIHVIDEVILPAEKK